MKEKRVMLVFPDISERSWHKGYFHYGLAHISSYLKKNVSNIEISLLAIHDKKYSQSEFKSRIKEFKPNVIGFTSTSHSFPLIQRIAKWAKEVEKDILTVCGGVHVTINPEEALLSSELDVVVCGDGEYPMKVLVERWIAQGVIPDENGVWYRGANRIVKNGLSAVSNLDELPDPDWELFDYMNLDEGSRGIGGLMLSRGCPYQCAYCCNHKIADIYRKNNAEYVRFKSVDKSISEIKNFINKFPLIHTLYFDDDILPLRKQWFIEFAGRYKKGINKPYWCNIRPNLVNEEIVDAFYNSGCLRVGIGIESGNENIRNQILKRNISEQTIINAAALLKKKKIYVFSFNMVGLPGETKEELLDTIRLNAKLGVDKMQCSVFYPYKHTALYDLIIKKGLSINEKLLIEYTQESILKFGYAQKNRIYFTVLMINLVAKVYKVLPSFTAELFLGMLYSSLSAILFLPAMNFLIRKLLSNKGFTLKLRKLFEWFVPPPPTACKANK
jgi:anaerobic magnesium-protoporphyrin IX monomethyl ester cyclase